MEIDLTQLSSYGKPLLIGGLSLTTLWTLIWPIFKKWFDSLPKTNVEKTVAAPEEPEVLKKQTAYSTDRSSPVGFKEHVNIIIQASLYAEASTKLKYLSAGLTEAQVLKNEVARMGSKVSISLINPIPEITVEESKP